MSEKIICRALAAYYKTECNSTVIHPREVQTSLVTHKDLPYVRLMAGSTPVAVYRVRTVKGAHVLKRMKRYPVEVTHV